MIIYKATNKINGKIYIGMTTKSLEWRIQKHVQDSKRGRGMYFYEDLITFGPESFDWDVIATAESVSELEELEKYYISLYGTFDNPEVGYNRQSGGISGYEITREERISRSERVKGEKNPMYGVPSPSTGKKFSEEHRRRMSEASKGKPKSTTGLKNAASRPVINKTTREVFQTIKEASQVHGTSKPSIRKACLTGNPVKGQEWSYWYIGSTEDFK